MSPQTPWDSEPSGDPQNSPPQWRKSQAGVGRLRPFIVIVVVLVAVIWLFSAHHDPGDSAAPATDTSTATPYAPDTSDTSDTSTYSADTSTTDDAIEAGDCLSVDGPQPTSTGTVDVSNITEVDCGSSSAQYKVVGVEPLTTDMNSCTTDYPDATSALLDQGPYFSFVYCVVDASS